MNDHLLELGVTPKFTKTEAIQNLNTPKMLKQSRSFLGSINHLSKSILNAESPDKLRLLLEGHGYVDYLSREPHIDPWHESELDKNFVLASIDSIHKALDGISSRLENNCLRNRNENVLEQPRTKKVQLTSLQGCNGKRIGQKQTKLNRNKINSQTENF